MGIRKATQIIYIAIFILLAGTTWAALYDGGYHIAGGAIAGLAAGSAVLSLLPFFVSQRLFRRFEEKPGANRRFKRWGIVVFSFCFPVKAWIILSNLALLIFGGEGWVFG